MFNFGTKNAQFYYGEAVTAVRRNRKIVVSQLLIVQFGQTMYQNTRLDEL